MKSNGGLNSLTEIVSSLPMTKRVILTNRESKWTQILSEAGCQVMIYNMGGGNRWSRLYRMFAFSKRLRKIAQQHQIEIIHFNDIQSILAGILGTTFLRVKRVLAIRSVKASYETYGIHWTLTNLCHQIITLSVSMKDELTRRLPLIGSAKHRIKKIYSIVDHNRFYKASKNDLLKIRQALDLHPNRNHCVVGAAFNDVKNQLEFLASLDAEYLLRAGIMIHFLGDYQPRQNSYSKRCHDIVQQKNLSDHIRFHGHVNNIAHWYSSADLTLVISKREGLARNMIESLSTGTPVISFDVCSAEEILSDYDCGIVVKQGDYEALQQAMVTLLGDKELYERLSQNAADCSKKLFDRTTIINQYLTTYGQLVVSKNKSN